eukprot:s21_g40.t2
MLRRPTLPFSAGALEPSDGQVLERDEKANPPKAGESIGATPVVLGLPISDRRAEFAKDAKDAKVQAIAEDEEHPRSPQCMTSQGPQAAMVMASEAVLGFAAAEEAPPDENLERAEGFEPEMKGIEAIAKHPDVKLVRGPTLWCQQFDALFRKRALSVRRDRRAWASQLLLPSIFVFLALLTARFSARDLAKTATLSVTDPKDWSIAACPPLPRDMDDIDDTLNLMSCIHGKQKESSRHFYIRQWYRHIEAGTCEKELSMKAFRCHQDKDIQELMDRTLCLVKFKDCFELHKRCLANAWHILAHLQFLAQEVSPAVPTAIWGLRLSSGSPAVPSEMRPGSAHCDLELAAWSWQLRCPTMSHTLVSACADCKGCSARPKLEGHAARRAVLKQEFGHRRNLVIVSQLAMRETVGRVLEDATWNNLDLRDAEVDLLQITFGANDCEILRGIVESSFRPRFVRAIFWHPVPPPLVYQPRAHRLLGDWYEDAFEANFVRRDLVQSRNNPFNLSNIEDDAQDLQAFWAARFNNTACFLNNHVFDTLMVDPRLMQELTVNLPTQFGILEVKIDEPPLKLSTDMLSGTVWAGSARVIQTHEIPFSKELKGALAENVYEAFDKGKGSRDSLDLLGGNETMGRYLLEERSNDNLGTSYGAISLSGEEKGQANLTLWFSRQAYHGVPVMVNLWNNARMQLLGMGQSNVQVFSHPLPKTQQLVQEEMSGGRHVTRAPTELPPKAGSELDSVAALPPP